MINTVKNKVFETANKFDLQMGLCGHVITGPEWSRSDDSIPYTKLYCIIDGQGYILHGGEKIPLEPGYVYLLPYDIKHGLLCENSRKYLLICSVLLVCLAVFGGSLIPEEFLPDSFQQIAGWLPNRNFTRVMGVVWP